MDEEKFYHDAHASGTDHYYYMNLMKNFVVTDGVKFMTSKLECFWLMDIVASYVAKIDKLDLDFCVVYVRVNKEDDTAVFSVDDGNGKTVISQKIPFTDISENVRCYLAAGKLNSLFSVAHLCNAHINHRKKQISKISYLVKIKSTLIF